MAWARAGPLVGRGLPVKLPQAGQAPVDGILIGAHGRAEIAGPPARFVCGPWLLYGERMARLVSTTVRLEEEDVRALKRARAAGIPASELIRKGLRVVASRYYSGRRPPSTHLFESTNSKLGDESELFRDIKD